jgi:hypothetical protein
MQVVLGGSASAGGRRADRRQKLGEMGGLLKKTFFGDHLVHYDD